MRTVLRLLVGIVGLLCLLIALAVWANPAGPAAKFGLDLIGGLGRASMRADFAGFFAGAGILALAAALRRDARLLTAPLLLVCVALAGRVLTAGMDGFTTDMAAPMAVETVLIVVLGVGRRLIGVR
ncbi:MAG: hypothetical protein IV086_17465 [Hyphomonadaceae bacterium]|nr:MAG: hypothetical protein FD160_3113 [Caulobacteraceae bacterium]MBT9447494.1 hypothetical protein [Hyphomonadaceae bacterium]TPW08503.1 MAG: hypothetical protein FD124_365 [Alphaproteobacteria bacterium]